MGQPPSVSDQELDVPAIHLPQDISVDLLSKDELVEDRMKIKEDKA